MLDIATLRAAAAPLDAAVRSVDAVAGRDLPRVLGRDDAVRQRATQLANARTDAQRAIDELAGIDDPGVVHARAGVQQLVDALAVPEQVPGWKRRPALPDATSRALEVARESSVFLDRTAEGLEAAARGEARRFLIDRVDHSEVTSRELRFELKRIVAGAAREELGPAARAWVPDRSELVPRGPWDTFPGANAEYRFWQTLRDTDHPGQFAWSDWVPHPGRPLPASVLRARFEQAVAANVGGTPRTPDWLARAADDELLTLDEIDAKELDLLATRSSRARVEEDVVLKLHSRWRIEGEIDRGNVLWRAAHRLPEDLRPDIPQAVLDEHVNALAALRTHTTTRAAERVAAGESPYDVTLEAANQEVRYSSARNATHIAQTVIPRRAGDPALQPLQDELHALIGRNAARLDGTLRDGYASHVDYGEHGRAMQLVETLRALEQRAPIEDPANAAAAEALAW